MLTEKQKWEATEDLLSKEDISVTFHVNGMDMEVSPERAIAIIEDYALSNKDWLSIEEHFEGVC